MDESQWLISSLCTLVICSPYSAPTWFEPLTGLAFTRRFDKVITTPGESKQNSYIAEKFLCVPKHGVLYCRKGVDKDPSSKKALCRLILPYSSAPSQHYLAHDTVSPSCRTDIFQCDCCNYQQTVPSRCCVTSLAPGKPVAAKSTALQQENKGSSSPGPSHFQFHPAASGSCGLSLRSRSSCCAGHLHVSQQ